MEDQKITVLEATALLRGRFEESKQVVALYTLFLRHNNLGQFIQEVSDVYTSFTKMATIVRALESCILMKEEPKKAAMKLFSFDVIVSDLYNLLETQEEQGDFQSKYNYLHDLEMSQL